MMSRKIKPRLTQRRDSLVFDPWILFPVLALMAIGLLMVASASMVVSDHYYANSFHFVVGESSKVCYLAEELFFALAP
jgi:cell division protein FtsW